MPHWTYYDHQRPDGSACTTCPDGTLRHLTWSEIIAMHGSATEAISTWGRAIRAEYRQLKDCGYVPRGHVIRCDDCSAFHILHSAYDCEAVWPVSSPPAPYQEVDCPACRQTLVVVPGRLGSLRVAYFRSWRDVTTRWIWLVPA